jgi:hypothetical protein
MQGFKQSAFYNKKMKSTEYKGKVSGMKASPWLGSEDLLGISPQEVKISGVFQHEDVQLEAGRKEKMLFAVGFEKIPKQLILNATNRKALSRLFGADVKNWAGKSVSLYVQDGIRKPGGKAGETTTGLRIGAPGATPIKTAKEVLRGLE